MMRHDTDNPCTHFCVDPKNADAFLCESCAVTRGIDLGAVDAEVWETYSDGWLGPVACAECGLNLPVYMEGAWNDDD